MAAGLSAAQEHVKQNGEDDDHADDDVADGHRRADELKTVLEHAPDRGADDGAEQDALAAERETPPITDAATAYIS